MSLLLFQNLLADYKTKRDTLKHDFDLEMSAEDVIEKQEKLLETYEGYISECKKEFKAEAESLAAKLRNAEKYADPSTINYEVISHLDTVASLTSVSREVLLSALVETVKSPSIASIQKAKEVLERYNVSIVLPNPFEANEYIKATEEEVIKLIESYDVDNVGNIPRINGAWVSNLNTDFEAVTTSDLKSGNKRDLFNVLSARLDLKAKESTLEQVARNLKSRIDRMN